MVGFEDVKNFLESFTKENDDRLFLEFIGHGDIDKPPAERIEERKLGFIVIPIDDGYSDYLYVLKDTGEIFRTDALGAMTDLTQGVKEQVPYTVGANG